MVDAPDGTRTFLFTDIEGSTPLWDEHPEAMREALAQHDSLLRDAIERHGGHVVKNTGDGLYAVLPSPAEAAVASADALRALAEAEWGETGPLRVRMGIHTGPAEERDGDYFGVALNRAARLMSAAHGGQVVLSEAAAAAARHTLPEDLSLQDLGEHRLRGLAQPQALHQLIAAGLPSQFPPLRSLEAFPGVLPLPGPMFASGDIGLAGRAAELDRLESAWARAVGGASQVALLTGEPGIGKTRLAAELSRRAHDQGGVVLYGRCDEDAIVPYQPFVEALRPYIEACPPSTLQERLHGLEQDLARLFPELPGRLPAASPSKSNDPETERYRLFEAITAVLTGIAATRPVLLVIDDVHWADKPTVLLLRHVARAARRSALLVLVSYRDVEVEPDHPVNDLLVDLRREPFVSSEALDGLSPTDSGDLLRGVAGHDVAVPLAEALHQETGGNPLFLGELLRHLAESEVSLVEPADARVQALDLPEGVRDVLVRRIRRLPAEVGEVLGLAAVVGREFDAGLLQRATGRTAEEVLEALDHAVRVGLVDEDSAWIGRYAFSHALIRQTIYGELGTAQRAQLHRSVGQAMEEGQGSERMAAALAQHFTQAVPLGEAPKAIDYAVRAGRQAIAELAFEDGAAHLDRALGLVEQHTPDDRSRRVELLTEMAEALVYVDDRAGARAALRAVDAARAEGSAERLGRAVAAYADQPYSLFAQPQQVATLLDEARSALDDGHPQLRARLLAFEAFAYASYQLHGRDPRPLAEEALDLARQEADPDTLGNALFTLAIILQGTAGTDERLALGEELVGLGRRASGRASTGTAYGLRVMAGAQLELGDAVALDATISEMARFGEEQRWLPAEAFATQWRATQALLEGRFDDVRSCWKDMDRLQHAYSPLAGMHLMQSIYLSRDEGDLGDLALPLEQMTVELPDHFYAHAILALARLEAGDGAGARETLDGLAARQFNQHNRQSSWAAVLGFLAEATARCPAPEHAALLYDLLSPFEGRLLVALLGLGCVGSADRHLGILSTVLGRWDEAAAHFERAIALEERARGHALVPRTRYWQARFLQAQARPGDDDQAGALLEVVAKEAAALGMRRLSEDATAALSS